MLTSCCAAGCGPARCRQCLLLPVQKRFQGGTYAAGDTDFKNLMQEGAVTNDVNVVLDGVEPPCETVLQDTGNRHISCDWQTDKSRVTVASHTDRYTHRKTPDKLY